MRRRHFLNTAGLTMLAGCTSSENLSTESAMPTDSPTPTPTPSTKGKIRDIVSKKFKKNKPIDGEIIEIKIGPDEEGISEDDLGVGLNYNHKPAGDLKYDKNTFHELSYAMSETLFTQELPIGFVSVTAYVEVEDQYGQVSKEALAQYGLSRKTAKKIVWENVTHLDVPQFADIYSFRTDLY